MMSALHALKYAQRRCGELRLYSLYYFVTHFLEEQSAKNCLDWCTINEDNGQTYRFQLGLTFLDHFLDKHVMYQEI